MARGSLKRINGFGETIAFRDQQRDNLFSLHLAKYYHCIEPGFSARPDNAYLSEPSNSGSFAAKCAYSDTYQNCLMIISSDSHDSWKALGWGKPDAFNSFT